jgi:hypothetical protein
MAATSDRSILAYAFAASLWLTATAQAAVDCPDGASCSSAQPSSPTLRATIDQQRNDLAERLFGVQFSAFGDVRSFYDDNGKKKLDWGAFELDASADFLDALQGAYALELTPKNTKQTVGLVDLHTAGIGRIAPRGRLAVEKGYHIQLGRFDIPFGNDWQFFPSKDSVSISRPLTTEQFMGGGFNDEGIRLLGNTGSTNFTAFLVHGFNNGRLAGGRLGLTPFNTPFSLKGVLEPKFLELGWSYLYDASASGSNWVKNEIAWAVDAEAHHGDWRIRVEYMLRKKEPALGQDDRMSGWHVTQEWGLDDTLALPITALLRYEQTLMRPSEISILGPDTGDERDVRIATGFKVNLGNSDVFLWKVELQHYLSATPSTRAQPGFGQGVMWFTQLELVL